MRTWRKVSETDLLCHCNLSELPQDFSTSSFASGIQNLHQFRVDGEEITSLISMQTMRSRIQDYTALGSKITDYGSRHRLIKCVAARIPASKLLH